MSLVASRFLHLSEISQRSAFIGMYHGYKISYEFIASVLQYPGLICPVGNECSHMVVFIEGYSLIVYMYVIAKNTDVHQTERIAQTPV